MIISRQNEKIKKIRSLKEKKYRDKFGEYVIYGYKLVGEAVDLRLPITLIVGTEDTLIKRGFTEGVRDGYEVVSVSDDVYYSLTEEASPQGILAVVKKPTAQIKKPSGDCLLLDGISDPGNLGTIIRTAAAADIKELYLASCADAFNPKTVRSSMGGLFRVTVYECDRASALEIIDKPIVVADMDGINVFEHEAEGDFCLAIGNEANGVSNEVRERASIKTAIPMANGVESLNAGVSAGIIMYALKNRKK